MEHIFTSHMLDADDLPPGIDEALGRIVQRHVRASLGSGDDGGGNGFFERFWKFLLIVVTIAVAGFTIGMNWHRVDALTAEFEKQVTANEADHATFARRETVETERTNTQRQLDEVKVLLNEVLRRQGIRR